MGHNVRCIPGSDTIMGLSLDCQDVYLVNAQKILLLYTSSVRTRAIPLFRPKNRCPSVYLSPLTGVCVCVCPPSRTPAQKLMFVCVSLFRPKNRYLYVSLSTPSHTLVKKPVFVCVLVCVLVPYSVPKTGVLCVFAPLPYPHSRTYTNC